MPKSLELHCVFIGISKVRCHFKPFSRCVVVDISFSLSFFFGIDVNKKGGFSSSCLLSNI